MNLKKLFTKKPNVPSAALKFEHMIDWCGGCYWREIKRHQKCSCCRRNQNMKDNYEPSCAAQEGAVERENRDHQG